MKTLQIYRRNAGNNLTSNLQLPEIAAEFFQGTDCLPFTTKKRRTSHNSLRLLNLIVLAFPKQLFSYLRLE